MNKPKWNPSSVTLEDVQGMGPKEFRTWNFLELKEIHKANIECKATLKGLDTRMWAALISIVVTLLLILGEHVV